MIHYAANLMNGNGTCSLLLVGAFVNVMITLMLSFHLFISDLCAPATLVLSEVEREFETVGLEMQPS